MYHLFNACGSIDLSIILSNDFRILLNSIMIVLTSIKDTGTGFPFRAFGEPLVFLAVIICGLYIHCMQHGIPRALWKSDKRNRIFFGLFLMELAISTVFLFSAGWPYTFAQLFVLILNYDTFTGRKAMPFPLWMLNIFWLLVLVGVPRSLFGAGIQHSTIESCVSYYVLENSKPTLMCGYAWLVTLEVFGALLVGGQFLLTLISYLNESKLTQKSVNLVDDLQVQ